MDMMTLTLTIVTLITFHLTSSNEIQHSTFWKVAGKKFKQNNHYERAVFSHRHFCLSRCVYDDRCKSVAWNSLTNECQFSGSTVMHDRMRHHRMEFDTNWTGYTIERLPVFNAQHPLGKDRFTLDEAFKVCEERGHHLASYSDMTSAHADGFRLCACGWVSDGRKVVVHQRYSMDCDYLTKNGTLECNPFLLADAWCKIDR